MATASLRLTSAETNAPGFLARVQSRLEKAGRMELRKRIFAARSNEALIDLHVERAREFVQLFAETEAPDRLLQQYLSSVEVTRATHDVILQRALASLDL